MLRPYREEDREDVLRIWLEASLQAHSFAGAGHWQAELKNMREVYLPLCDAILVWTGGEDGTPRGFLAFVGDYLAALFVEPGFQGRGIGSRLMRVALRMHPELTLSVYRENTRAVGFYRRHGLEVLEERVERATGLAEYVMGRSGITAPMTDP